MVLITPLVQQTEEWSVISVKKNFKKKKRIKFLAFDNLCMKDTEYDTSCAMFSNFVFLLLRVAITSEKHSLKLHTQVPVTVIQQKR